MIDQTEAPEMDAPAEAPRGRRPVRARVIPSRRGAVRAPPRATPVDRRTQSEDRGEPRAETRPTEERLYRNRPDDGYDYSIDLSIVPAGWSYEWKRRSVFGKPDTRHMNGLGQNHWKDVPASRHPDVATEEPTGSIVVDGMVLMERPLYLTKEARQESLVKAHDQVRSVSDRLGATPSGTMTRNHATAKAMVNRSYDPFDPSTVSE